MKANVDLTNGRVFRDKNNFNVERKYPYKPSNLDKILIDGENIKDNWGIFQGNHDERFSKKKFKEYQEENTCERCGKTILPYNKIIGLLCKGCDEWLEQSVSLSSRVLGGTI